MKYIIRSALFVLLTFSLPFSLLAHAATENYTFDPMHTYVLWHANHFGFSNPSGKWLVNGALAFDQNNLKNSKVNVTINMADLVTAIPKLDEHLKSKDFLNAPLFPTSTFVSNKIDVIDKHTLKVHGTLTLHGISKPVALNVIINKIGISPITKKMTVGFTANTILKRSDFGITTYLPGISDQVKINIEAEAYKAG